MALVDTLDYFPASHPGRERLLVYLRSLVDAIVLAQDKRTKGWWLIMTPGFEGVRGNYIESSFLLFSFFSLHPKYPVPQMLSVWSTSLG